MAKKLMTIAVVMIMAFVAYCDIQSSNIVGYTGSDTINGFRAVGLSFNSVGDVPKYKDLKVTGYTGEYKSARIYFQLLSASGSKVGQSYMWNDFEYAGDPNDPEDPPASYHGWYGVQTGEDANEVFNQAIANIMPALEVKARRVGGSTYQVPVEIRPERRQTLALRWLVSFSRNRSERDMAAKLAGEIIDASNNTGNAVKRREDMHKMAEANKAFAHYRW